MTEKLLFILKKKKITIQIYAKKSEGGEDFVSSKH